MFVGWIAQWLRAPRQSNQRLARWAANALRIRIRPAQNLVDVIFELTVIIVIWRTRLCHRLSQCLPRRAVVALGSGRSSANSVRSSQSLERPKASEAFAWREKTGVSTAATDRR